MSKSLRVLTFPLMLILPMLVAAQDLSELTTGGMANGRLWQKFNESNRATYVMGYIDTLVAKSMTSPRPPEDMKQWYAFGSNVGDYVKALDSLYSVPENIRIPIPFALQYCTARMNGDMTQQQLEQLLIDHRKLAATWGSKVPWI